MRTNEGTKLPHSQTRVSKNLLWSTFDLAARGPVALKHNRFHYPAPVAAVGGVYQHASLSLVQSS